MIGPASNAVLGTDPVQLLRTSTGEDKFPVGVQSTIEGGTHEGRIARIHSEDLCLSYPFNPETWKGRAGWRDEVITTMSLTLFEIWLEQTQKPPPLSTGWYAHLPYQP